MTQCVIDHIVITAPTLDAGAELVKKSLGVIPQKGGEHPQMGTHNLLLHLGNDIYLEVIACNPMAEPPKRSRWFGLDEINENTPAKLKTWVVRTKNIHSTFNISSESLGNIEPMNRGETNWLITIPKDGNLPINEGAPALIEWKTKVHPTTKLIDHGLSLVDLRIHNPAVKRIKKLLDSINLVDDVKIFKSDVPKICASINTPSGLKELNA